MSAGDPDMAALDVLGDVLNSFGGRLFDRIRSREVPRLLCCAVPAHALPHPPLSACTSRTACALGQRRCARHPRVPMCQGELAHTLQLEALHT